MAETAARPKITELFLEIAERYSLRDPDQISCHGITLSECYTLRRLRRSAGLQVTEISAAFGWNKSTASRVVRSLQRKKLVRLTADERHHLARRVRLTAKGEALVARVEEQVARRYEEMLRRHAAEDVAGAEAVLRSWLECLRGQCGAR